MHPTAQQLFTKFTNTDIYNESVYAKEKSRIFPVLKTETGTGKMSVKSGTVAGTEGMTGFRKHRIIPR